MAGENSFFLGSVLVCLLAGGGIWLNQKQKSFRFFTFHSPFRDRVLSNSCPAVTPPKKGSCDVYGQRCVRVSMPSHIRDQEVDSVSVSDGIKMSLRLSSAEDTGSLDITADAAVMDLLDIEWKEVQKGIIGGKRRVALSLSVKEPWDEDCHFDVAASLTANTQFSNLEATKAEITVDGRMLAKELTVKASGSAHISTSASGIFNTTVMPRDKLELTASGASVVDMQDVPINYVKANVQGMSDVTLTGIKTVKAQCTGLSHIGIMGKPLVDEDKEGDCTITFGWTSWVKSKVRKMIRFTEKVFLYLFLGTVVAMSAVLFLCGCTDTVARVIKVIILVALLIWLFILSSNQFL